MSAVKIDMETWNRKDMYQHFCHTSNPFWSVTYEEDVTDLLRYSQTNSLSFYSVMIWTVTQALNRVPAFLYTIRDHEVYLLDQRYPSFTFLKKNSDLFQIATVDRSYDHVIDFCKAAKDIISTQECFLNESKETDELVFLSCLPWINITGLTNEGMTDPDDSIPRIAWGRYHQEHGRTVLSMSFEVNHKFIDGLHIAQFHQAFQDISDQLRPRML